MDAHIPFNKGAIRPVDCISEGWAILRDRYWLFFLFITIGIIIVTFIPILRWFLYGPMVVGAYYALLQQQRGAPISAESFLKGFQIFVPAMIVGLIENFFQLINDVLSIFVNSLNLIPMFMDLDKLRPKGSTSSLATGAPVAALAATDAEKLMAGAVGFVAILIVIVFVIAIVVSFVWRITFMFALPLLADHPELTPLEAISLGARAGWANAGGLILLMLLQWLWMLIGCVAVVIGMIFVVPVIFASDIAAYRMVFPEIPPDQLPHSEPPRPDYYGSSFGQGA